MNSICVFTCITGNYDNLQELKTISSNIDYICFTDKNIVSLTWKIRKIPIELQYLSKVKQQRIIKILAHKYLSEYDISLWIDGNIQIIGDINTFIRQYDLNISPLYVRIHPSRNCLYKEANAVLAYNKELSSIVNMQIDRYKDSGYPKNIGMVETGILLRKHNNLKCVLLCNEWAIELINYSHRDQLSFNYICWKNRFIPGYMTNEFKINNSFFIINKHNY